MTQLILKDVHPDVERFLAEDCYCPNEFYSFDGFGYKLFDKDTPVKLLGENKKLIACLELSSEKDPQVLILFKDPDNQDTRILDNFRYDATENNIEITIKHLLIDDPLQKTYPFDEYVPGTMKKTINELMDIADAITID